ncbi:MAG TPA: zf-HC2 domain-containing protein [Nannocystaceae bacterium]|nr:zf-HC2 domain-containing protein [Nannocystaceae bacterium]
MNEQMHGRMHELFARDGHLTMLTLDRYEVGELAGEERHAIETHVEGCPRCRARWLAVATPGVAIAPPLVADRSTGSAVISVLAGAAGLALAASAVLGVGSAMWPSPQAARESLPDAVARNASSYTSVATEYSETGDLDLDLDVSTRGDALVVSPTGEGWLAVVAIDDHDAIAAVLLAARVRDEATTVTVPRRFAADRVLAVLCPDPFELAVGDRSVFGPDCVVRDR